MKIYVWKKRHDFLLANIVIIIAIMLPLLIFFAANEMERILFIPIATLTIIIIFFAIIKTRNECARIIFGEYDVKCVFFGWNRRILPYSEIKEIVFFIAGTPQLGTARFIGITKIEIPEHQKTTQCIGYISKQRTLLWWNMMRAL